MRRKGSKSPDSVKAVKYKLAKAFPDMPEGRLMCAVVVRALEDAHGIGLDSNHFNKLQKQYVRLDGLRFFYGEIWAAEIAGVCSNYVRRTIADAGIDLDALLDDIQQKIQKHEAMQNV